MFYYNPYAFPPFFAALLIISSGIYVWSRKIKSGLNFSWFLFCLSLFLWLINDAVLFCTRDKNLAIFISKCVYLGVNGIPLSAVFFSLKITKSKSKLLEFLLILTYFFLNLLTFKTDLLLKGVHNFYFGFYPAAAKYHTPYLILWIATLIFSTIFILKKSKNPRISREEQKWLLYTFWIFLCGDLIGPTDFFQKYGIEFYPFGYICIPIMVGLLTFAVLKHKMLDIQLAIRKSLLYSVLLGILSAIYLLLILVIEALFKGFIGYKSFYVSLFSAFIIAFLFNPLRNKLQTLVDKLFLGKSSQEFAHENELLLHELERSDRLKAASTLALGLDHEIKNPLTTIKTFSEYIKEKHNDEEFINKFSRLVPSEVERINNIVHRLLDFSKPAPPTFQKTNICLLIDDILEFLNSKFLSHHIVIEKNYEKDDCQIKIDSSQIKQVFLNILLNAIEAMPKGGKITVKIITNPNDYLEIDIVDTGSGISKENLKHIFDPFFTTKDTGSGLGLSIVHQIIQNHRGKIDAESEIGKGTKVKIQLPNQKTINVDY